jgi:hypothetical protein
VVLVLAEEFGEAFGGTAIDRVAVRAKQTGGAVSE